MFLTVIAYKYTRLRPFRIHVTPNTGYTRALKNGRVFFRNLGPNELFIISNLRILKTSHEKFQNMLSSKILMIEGITNKKPTIWLSSYYTILTFNA